jgi:hypothetical protein
MLRVATGSRYTPPRAISTQAVRATLLAIATAAILGVTPL